MAKVLAPFHLQEFSLAHDRCAHPVGTDGLLLGAWAQIPLAQSRVLEIGHGSGLISLILAQRFPTAQLHGLEIDPASWEQSCDNARHSPFSARVHFEQADFLAWEPKNAYHYLLSNPPFFRASLLAERATRSRARHQTALSHQAILAKGQRLLLPQGRLALILPLAEGEALLASKASSSWHLHRKTWVYGKQGAGPIRLLLEWGLAPGDCREEQLFLRDTQGAWHPQYKAMMAPFLTSPEFRG